jgi:putative hydrolase of HD superfamily
MPRTIDVNDWSRKATFESFRDFDDPYFDVTAQLEVTPLVSLCDSEELSFALSSQYLALRVANEYEPFRYRLEDGEVLVYDTVHAGITELLDDERLAVLNVDYHPDFAVFRDRAEKARRDLADPPDELTRAEQSNVIHFSTLPGVSFTSISHARNGGGTDSVPKITFGKYHHSEGRLLLPVSVEAHRAVVDGRHVGRFLERLQRYFEAPAPIRVLPSGEERGRRSRAVDDGDLPAFSKELDDLLEFLQRAERLKDVVRSGYTSEGRQESVAAHTWRLCLMALLLHERFPDVDFARLVKMCLVHDLGEAIRGDVPAPEQAESGKAEQERRDLLILLEPLPDRLRDEITGLWDEYESAETPEARLAKSLDKLETLLQHTQGDNPPDFDYQFNLQYGREYTSGDPTIEALRAALDEKTRKRARE